MLLWWVPLLAFGFVLFGHSQDLGGLTIIAAALLFFPCYVPAKIKDINES